MFGRQELKNQIEYYKGMYEQYADKFVSERDAREALSKELDQALESGTGYESQVIQLTEELTHERVFSQALADENRDLLYQLELHKSLLGQLDICAQFPKPKPARKK